MDDQSLLIELKTRLRYDLDTGNFYWIKTKSDRVKAGDVAGSLDKAGYVKIIVTLDGGNKVYIRCHRLAWLFMFDKFPDNEIDHINGIKNDNRIANLRDVSTAINQQNRRLPNKNSKTGLLGVSNYSRTGKWMAKININKKQTFLGYFESPELAHQAYLATKRQLHKGNTL